MKKAEKCSEMLNELLKKNCDTEKVFSSAADDVKNERLKDFFNEKAMQRYEFGQELRSEVRSFGETPEKESSLKGDVHRAWMNLKATLSTDREDAVLEEVIRAEKAAVRDYNEMIRKDGFPPSTANMLIKQRNLIEKTLVEAAELEKAFR